MSVEKHERELEAQRQEPGGFGEWLKANPMPDLQELVRKHGGYDKIDAAAWAEHDRALEDWLQRYRLRNGLMPVAKG